ncbi:MULTISPECIES: M20/M25/M40 family metallo-hydrolase [Microcoleaceae]|uniref:M20/M25/M40 family metallo-hydrolase n=1 Tax=Microcoleaceae TaxID=1892252 RepID=UPI001882B70A|nr:M20/M25/M40 family metallo-hydrolase [Tychonema sp. LEGE 06208]MBE9163394.1 M20/M25/M40 family metallo-hydrolase [Tychonema sp. LEGE 06208]
MDLKERLQGHLIQIVRDRNPYLASAGHFYVQQYIREQLGQWGTVEIDDFAVRGRIHHNFILDLPPLNLPLAKGGKQENLPIVIGAHYDSVPGTPGADDNATGLAVLLELARNLALQPLKYPVQLVAFDMEEYGCWGSSHHAANLKKQKQQIRLMISLEMLGYCNNKPNSQSYPAGLKYFYPNIGNFIALIGNLRTVRDMITLSGNIRKSGQPCEWLPVPNRGLIVPDTRRSDHAPFWDNGYPAIMVTDTANMRNPHYHQASDKIETLDLDFLAGVCRGLVEAIGYL